MEPLIDGEYLEHAELELEAELENDIACNEREIRRHYRSMESVTVVIEVPRQQIRDAVYLLQRHRRHRPISDASQSYVDIPVDEMGERRRRHGELAENAVQVRLERLQPLEQEIRREIVEGLLRRERHRPHRRVELAQLHRDTGVRQTRIGGQQGLVLARAAARTRCSASISSRRCYSPWR